MSEIIVIKLFYYNHKHHHLNHFFKCGLDLFNFLEIKAIYITIKLKNIIVDIKIPNLTMTEE